MIRAGLIALAILVGAPLAASAQSIDLGGRDGPSIDLRSRQQRNDDFRRDDRRDMRRDAYRDDMRRDAYRDRDRDRDFSTGSTRRRGEY